MIFSIGDVILSDVYVGVVVGITDRYLLCNCSDGKQHKFEPQQVTMVSKFSDMLKSFERSILTNVSG